MTVQFAHNTILKISSLNCSVAVVLHPQHYHRCGAHHVSFACHILLIRLDGCYEMLLITLSNKFKNVQLSFILDIATLISF